MLTLSKRAALRGGIAAGCALSAGLGAGRYAAAAEPQPIDDGW